jgi:large subunit ribosomal protein L27
LTVQWHAGENVGCGKDYTIFSKVDGIVIYSKKKDQSKVRLHVLRS